MNAASKNEDHGVLGPTGLGGAVAVVNNFSAFRWLLKQLNVRTLNQPLS